jgi:hypothetical protein
MPPPEPPEPPEPLLELVVGSGSPGRVGKLGRLGTPGSDGNEGSVGKGNGRDGGLAVEDGFGAGEELCCVGLGKGSVGNESDGSGNGREEPVEDDDEGDGSGGNKPAKAGAPVSTRARVPAATVPTRRVALLGIFEVPPARFLEIANEPLPRK